MMVISARCRAIWRSCPQPVLPRISSSIHEKSQQPSDKPRLASLHYRSADPVMGTKLALHKFSRNPKKRAVRTSEGSNGARLRPSFPLHLTTHLSGFVSGETDASRVSVLGNPQNKDSSCHRQQSASPRQLFSYPMIVSEP